jgi:hypothetical protein
MKICHTF